MSSHIKLGITHGDVNGIGYEILLKTLSDSRLCELFTPIVYGSIKAISYHRKACNLKPVQFNTISDASDAKTGEINFINCVNDNLIIELGTSSKPAGEAAFQSLDKATADLKANAIDALITLPINKDSIQSEQFAFAGHTDYLQHQFGSDEQRALMIMVCDKLRVALATTHTPLSDVASSLSAKLISSKIVALNKSLIEDFNVDLPRIAVLGLNPHAGENGLLGNEEQTYISPAVAEAQEKGILCAGPFAADGFFGSGRYKEFDGILAMYHDQGLIPFKTIAMERGVNFTAGLPIVRTSPDHGTAYDLAGKGEASEESFREALYMAIDILRNRRAYAEAHSNPLRKLYFDKSKDDEKIDLSKDSDE